MKVFIAYDMNGENQEELLNNLEIISDALHAAGVESYSTHLQQDDAPSGKTMKDAFEMIDGSDAVLVFVQSANISEAMVLEIGYSYVRKPIHVFTKQGVQLSSFELADDITEWTDIEQLTQSVKERFDS
jgi:nucleoside 2-deoxyribosyltransferase